MYITLLHLILGSCQIPDYKNCGKGSFKVFLITKQTLLLWHMGFWSMYYQVARKDLWRPHVVAAMLKTACSSNNAVNVGSNNHLFCFKVNNEL